MLKLLEPFPYTLEDIAEKSTIGSIHSVRKYIQKVLPSSCYERSTDGRGARYSENTLNSFKVLKKLLDTGLLNWKQITKVLEALDQEQISRIARGEEALNIHVAVPDEADNLEDAASQERFVSDEQVLVIDGDEVRPINLNQEDAAPADNRIEREPWRSVPITDRLELRYKGNFTQEQIEELNVAARILKSIAED